MEDTSQQSSVVLKAEALPQHDRGDQPQAEGGCHYFEDGGLYCGQWNYNDQLGCNRAHGYGVCTGPKNLGEYSGLWSEAFETSGVYKSSSGVIYEGLWWDGKFNGHGVRYDGNLIYAGQWTNGLRGNYGVEYHTNSAARYEGAWTGGYKGGCGVEIHHSGGYYQGQFDRGNKNGYGVAKSSQYGDTPALTGVPFDPESNDTGLESSTIHEISTRNGTFVLVSKPIGRAPHSEEAPNTQDDSINDKIKHEPNRRSKRSWLFSPIFRYNVDTFSRESALRHLNRLRRPQSSTVCQSPYLLPEELGITNSTTCETYMGQWKDNKRTGYGVCERSDGLKYEGQWINDAKHGYGVTTFKDGSKEEGKYNYNFLCVDLSVRRLFKISTAHIRKKVDNAIELAQQARLIALKKADLADSRAATAKYAAVQARIAGIEANQNSRIAYKIAGHLRNIDNFPEKLKSTERIQPHPPIMEFRQSSLSIDFRTQMFRPTILRERKSDRSNASSITYLACDNCRRLVAQRSLDPKEISVKRDEVKEESMDLLQTKHRSASLNISNVAPGSRLHARYSSVNTDKTYSVGPLLIPSRKSINSIGSRQSLGRKKLLESNSTEQRGVSFGSGIFSASISSRTSIASRPDLGTIVEHQL